jgi:hypothetical protein
LKWSGGGGEESSWGDVSTKMYMKISNMFSLVEFLGEWKLSKVLEKSEQVIFRLKSLFIGYKFLLLSCIHRDLTKSTPRRLIRLQNFFTC